MDTPISRPVPLIRASVIQPFLEAARQIGSPVIRFMRAAGLPAEPMAPNEHPTLLLPEIPCWKLTRLIARHEGMDDFGLMAARSIAHHDISTIAPLIADCVTLKQLLKRIMEIAPLHAASGRYIVERQHNLVFFLQRGERWLEGDVQVQLFQLAGMIQLVRLAAGPDWHPEQVHFTFGKKPGWNPRLNLAPHGCISAVDTLLLHFLLTFCLCPCSSKKHPMSQQVLKCRH